MDPNAGCSLCWINFHDQPGNCATDVCESDGCGNLNMGQVWDSNNSGPFTCNVNDGF